MTDAMLAEPRSVSAEASADMPCTCGSGLRHRHCCGLPQPVRRVADELVSPALSALHAATETGERETIRTAALALLEIDPGHHVALGTLYNVLNAEGAGEAAGVVIDRAATLHMNNPQLRAIAAQHFLMREEPMRAQIHARMLVRLAPLSPLSHMLMGRAFFSGHRMNAAEYHLRKALEIGRDAILMPQGISETETAELEAFLASTLREQGRIDEARAIYHRLAERWPSDLRLLLEWAKLEEADRKFDDAAALLDRAAVIAPDGPRVASARATLQRRRNEPEAALRTLQALSETGAEESDLLQQGQILDSLQRYDEAFAAFSAFKARVRERTGHQYLAEHAGQLVRNLREFFTESRTRMLPRATVRADRPQPIFIVGFPRSGTTLIEQTLSAHPNIAAGDELPIINQIADRSRVLLGSPGDYPKSLSELWLGDRAGLVETMRDQYLNEAAQLGALDPSKPWFTDKMPLNETHLGLIHILFPQSPIIHLVRHPLDVVLSVFSNALTHGFYCANGLESAAQHYALIADLIAHYRQALPLRYHAVRYEALVTDQESHVRALFEFIGEPFDEATLAFHENARFARTASYAQVTEKLYTRSVYRHRNYLRHLEPVMPILSPVIERLGYALGELG